MSEYDAVRSSKLVLKGEKRKKKSKHSSKEKKVRTNKSESLEEANSYGGWFRLSEHTSLSGPVCIEVRPRRFLRALDNGSLEIGPQHEPGECPDPEEILTCLRIGDSQIAFKTGYDKFVGLTGGCQLQAVSDAAGQRELFEPVFEDDKFALVASGNGCFLSVTDDLLQLKATSQTAGEREHLKIRSSVDPDRIRRDKEKNSIPVEERGSLNDCEEQYLKKFHGDAQRAIGKRLIAGGAGELKRAKDQGSLHETLLDRRSKVKSDKFCK